MFNQENNEHPAESNSSIYKNKKYILFKNNPRYDFINQQRLYKIL